MISACFCCCGLAYKFEQSLMIESVSGILDDASLISPNSYCARANWLSVNPDRWRTIHWKFKHGCSWQTAEKMTLCSWAVHGWLLIVSIIWSTNRVTVSVKSDSSYYDDSWLNTSGGAIREYILTLSKKIGGKLGHMTLAGTAGSKKKYLTGTSANSVVCSMCSANAVAKGSRASGS